MRPLIIDDKIRSQLEELRKFAEENIINIDKYQELQKIIPVGDIPGFKAELPFGYKIALSLEDHGKHGRLYHASFSIDTVGKCPSPQAVELMLETLGLKHRSDQWNHCWMEEIGKDHQAVNVLCQSVEIVEKNG